MATACSWCHRTLSRGGNIDEDGLFIRLDTSRTFCVNADLDYLDVATVGKRASMDRYYSADHHFLCHCQVMMP